MLNIYILENVSKMDNEGLINKLPPFFQDRVNQYTNHELRNARISAYYLLIKKVKELFGFKVTEFGRNHNGKPHILADELLDFDFNISHTKNTVVVAISDSEVGVDVMDYTNSFIEVAEKFFHENEKKALNKASDKNKEFLKIWSHKEAYLKYTGRGLYSKMAEVDTTKLSIPTKYFDKYLISYYPKEKEVKFIKVDKLTSN